MRGGFTLIELLVVLAIMGIVGITAFLNIGTFREDANLKSVTSDLQSYLRLAQANATTGVKCGETGGVSWFLVIKDRNTIQLRCQTQRSDDPSIREWTIKSPAQIDSIEGIGTLSCSFAITTNPVTVTFSYLEGQATFSYSAEACISNSTGIRVKVIRNTGSTILKTVTISKGGSIDVQ